MKITAEEFIDKSKKLARAILIAGGSATAAAPLACDILEAEVVGGPAPSAERDSFLHFLLMGLNINAIKAVREARPDATLRDAKAFVEEVVAAARHNGLMEPPRTEG